eukprot:scaffold2430_cov137-Isochrysis_galbana.AAC.6
MSARAHPTPRATPVPPPRVYVEHKANPPQPCKPEIIGRAPGEKLVPLPGSIRCVVGGCGCVLFEWWSFVVVWKKTTPRARGGVTMAPLQLRLEPTEVVLATDKGAARARVDSTHESSPQI